MKTMSITAATLMLLTGAAGHGQATVASGQAYPAVNGETIHCPVNTPPSAEQQAMQFDTAPRDLAALSEMARSFTDPNSEAAAQWRAVQAERNATDWPFLCRYRDANAELKRSGQRPQVVFMGDSITEGWIVADGEFFSSNGYVDRGISGQSSPQMVARFYHDVIALNPRVVHIMTGTNDIGGATGPITEDEYIGYVRAMIDMARANGIEVVLAAMPPMTMLLPRPDFDVKPWVRSMNARLKQTATEYGITFVDYYTPLADEAGAFDTAYANDGVHPTRAGYAVMEPLARRAIDAALAKSVP